MHPPNCASPPSFLWHDWLWAALELNGGQGILDLPTDHPIVASSPYNLHSTMRLVSSLVPAVKDVMILECNVSDIENLHEVTAKYVISKLVKPMSAS